MQKDDHDHAEVRETKATPGFEPMKAMTRYELAATLFAMVTHVESATAQPKRSPREVKPGRKSNMAPNPGKAKRFTDVPASHWAAKSIAGLNARSMTLVSTPTFEGDKTVTGNEAAGWLEGLAAWVEGRPAKARTARELAAAGYVPQTDALVKKATQPVAAIEVSKALVRVIARTQEKVTTISPDSRFAK
jgi:hypothetical protein